MHLEGIFSQLKQESNGWSKEKGLSRANVIKMQNNKTKKSLKHDQTPKPPIQNDESNVHAQNTFS